MINFDVTIKDSLKKDHRDRIFINEGPGSGKTNASLNPINHKLYTDKICLYAQNPCEAKY